MNRPSAGEFGELLGDLLRGLGEPQRFHRAFVMFGDHQISVRQTVIEQAVEVQRQLAGHQADEQRHRQIPEQREHVDPIMVGIHAADRPAHRVDAVGEW